MTSRTPAEPASEGDRSPGTAASPDPVTTPEPANAPAETDASADTGAERPRPGDLGGQAPAVEPARPNWSRLNGTATAESGEGGPATAVSTERRRVPLWLVLVLALVGFVADQGTKFWAMAALEPGSYRPLIGDLLGFQLVFNSGAAFSIAEGLTWVFTIVAVVVVVVIVRVARNLRSRAWALVLAGLLGGTLGNLFDRLFREPGVGRGYVVDFINYNGYFVGNVADIFIVVAAIGMGVLTFIGIGFDGRRESERAADQAADESPAAATGAPTDADTTADKSETTADKTDKTDEVEKAGKTDEAGKTGNTGNTGKADEIDETGKADETDDSADPADPAGPATPEDRG